MNLAAFDLNVTADDVNEAKAAATLSMKNLEKRSRMRTTARRLFARTFCSNFLFELFV
jgi:hypothetical protein